MRCADQISLRYRCIFIAFFFLLLPTNVTAQSDSSSFRYLPTVLSDTKLFFHDAGNFFSAPLHFSKQDVLLTGIIAGSAVTLFLLDDEVRSVTQKNQSSFLYDVSDISRIYGETSFGVGLSAGIYSVGLFSKNKEVRTTGLMVFESLAFSAAITHTLKVIIGRSRPYTNDGSTEFQGFQFAEEHVSLPSGHSTAAFAVSTVLAKQLNNKYATIGLFSLATLTALSRVYSDVHWSSDIFLGAAIGIVTGNNVFNMHRAESTQSSLHVLLTSRGLMLEILF
ncbi:MAG: phosphatase PAP2 family protein [Ignavibacteriae bacterium]|nr:phosphatase PAP2 family protein [Ignavibacteriota bacterium]